MIFVVIGALLEGLPALLIFGPILFPISRTVGLDPVHYGIVIVAAMGIAFFLPPVGVGLSIAAGIARVDIDDVSRTLRAVSGRAADRPGADRGVPGLHAGAAAAVPRVSWVTIGLEARDSGFGFSFLSAGIRIPNFEPRTPSPEPRHSIRPGT